MSAKLTICIPTFNREQCIKSTLEHLLKIDSREVEILVSDNCSDDNTWNYLNSISDSRLTISRNSSNIGFTGNMLKLIELSKTDAVMFMSDEDYVILDNVSKIVDTLSSNEDFGVYYPSVLHESKKSYYYKYRKLNLEKYCALNKVVLSHSYMSGMIINRKFLDIDKFVDVTRKEDVVLYPHEIMVYMILFEGGKLITDPTPIAYQGEAEESEALIKYNYSEYKERIKLFKQYNRVVSKLKYDVVSQNIFYKKMSIIAACVLVDEVLRKKVNPKEYISEINNLDCRWQFKVRFFVYSLAVMMKRAVNKVK